MTLCWLAGISIDDITISHCAAGGTSPIIVTAITSDDVDSAGTVDDRALKSRAVVYLPPNSGSIRQSEMTRAQAQHLSSL